MFAANDTTYTQLFSSCKQNEDRDDNSHCNNISNIFLEVSSVPFFTAVV